MSCTMIHKWLPIMRHYGFYFMGRHFSFTGYHLLVPIQTQLRFYNKL
nr:MAG TPA: hypothetical protein [Caudoviricetes sp.]